MMLPSAFAPANTEDPDASQTQIASRNAAFGPLDGVLLAPRGAGLSYGTGPHAPRPSLSPRRFVTNQYTTNTASSGMGASRAELLQLRAVAGEATQQEIWSDQ
jgi:hypothetical protein